MGILGLAAVLGLGSSVYPDRVHSLSVEDLQELRELHAAQYGTLQERDALLEEGAEDEDTWVNKRPRTHLHCPGVVGPQRRNHLWTQRLEAPPVRE